VSLFSTARPPPPSRPFLYTTLFRSPDCAPRDRPGAETARAVLRHRTPMGTVLGVGRVVGPRPVGRRCCANEREAARTPRVGVSRSEEHTSELQSRFEVVCRLLLVKN